jgi:hypothetical protein
MVPSIMLFSGGMSAYQTHHAAEMQRQAMAGAGGGGGGGGSRGLSLPVPKADPVPAVDAVSVWSGKQPLVCSGQEKWKAANLNVRVASGTLITADGSCEVTCTNCTLSAPTVISAGWNARITLVGGSITGSPTAVQAKGMAIVNLTTAKVSGKKEKDGVAEIR